ncbi:hypothetical protein AAF712_006311 [Marasmius tenuissimus]|uniref:F-box domain-containing protein n=1 Tax=Marasmius tenuissimus TaxID=585030 RepID=A0ABR3A066_9AGAR
MADSNERPPIESRLLKSDYVPTDLEISQTRLLLEEEELALAAQEQVLAGFCQVSDDHTIRRVKTIDRIAQLCSILSVQRKLPAELWDKIFALASLPDGQYSLTLRFFDQESSMPLSFPSLTISQVCSWWKHIAFNTPALWASISIEFASLPGSGYHILEIYLRNSKHHPLHLHLHLEGFYNNYVSPRAIRATWDAVTSSLPRCSSLSFKNLDDDLEIPPNSLQSLTVFDHATRDKRSLAKWKIALEDTPILTTVAMSFLYPLDSLPYSQLTSLRLRAVGQDDVTTFCTDILPSCERLVSLAFADLDTYDEGTRFERHHLASLPTLRTLDVFHEEEENGMEIYTAKLFTILSIHTPFLTTLRLEFWQEYAATKWPDFLTEFLKETSGSLHFLSLSIAYCDYSEKQALTDLLELVPNLTEFNIDMETTDWEGDSVDMESFGNFSRRYLDDLFHHIESKSDVLVPRLKSIAASTTGPMILDRDLVDRVLKAADSRILRSRSTDASVCSLANVNLTCRRDEDDTGWKKFKLATKARARIEALLRDGVRVSVRTLDQPPMPLKRRG